MWENIVIAILLLAFFILLSIGNQKEGFDNPYTISQQQQGDIEKLRIDMNKIKLSDESLSILDRDVTDITDKTFKLQQNLPHDELLSLAPN